MADKTFNALKSKGEKIESFKSDKALVKAFDALDKTVNKDLANYEKAFREAKKSLESKIKGAKDKKEKAELTSIHQALQKDFDMRLKGGKPV